MTLKQLFHGQLPGLVMFDLDGTLVDSVPDLETALNTMLRQQQLPEVSREQVENWIGNGIVKLIQRALVYSGLPEVAAQPESAAFLKYKTLFDTAYDQSCGQVSKLYPGVASALNQLQQAGISLAVITNKSERFTGTLLDCLGIADYFAMVVCGDTLTKKKPDPEPLLYVLERLGKSARQSVMVGDSRHDIAAARAAGVVCVAVPYGYNHGEPVENFHPDVLVNGLDEML